MRESGCSRPCAIRQVIYSAIHMRPYAGLKLKTRCPQQKKPAQDEKLRHPEE